MNYMAVNPVVRLMVSIPVYRLFDRAVSQITFSLPLRCIQTIDVWGSSRWTPVFTPFSFLSLAKRIAPGISLSNIHQVYQVFLSFRNYSRGSQIIRSQCRLMQASSNVD